MNKVLKENGNECTKINLPNKIKAFSIELFGVFTMIL